MEQLMCDLMRGLMAMLRAKTMFWMMVSSLILTLIGMAVMKSSGPVQKPSAVTTDQKLEALEKASGGSPEMQKFLRNERAAEKANQEAAEGPQ